MLKTMISPATAEPTPQATAQPAPRAKTQPPSPTAAEPAAKSGRRITTYELSTDLRIASARLTRRIRTERTGGDLSDGQYSVLAYLVREGATTLGALSRFERVTPPSMNRTVNHLEAAGYLVRTPSADDKRKVLFVATDAGRELVSETRKRRDAWLDRRLAKLPPQTRALLAEATTIIREIADS